MVSTTYDGKIAMKLFKGIVGIELDFYILNLNPNFVNNIEH